MKMKKVLAVGLSAVVIMSVVPVYADETDLVTFEDSPVSVEETDNNSVSFDDSEYDEETAKTESFASGDEELQIIDGETDDDNDFLFSDDADDIQMVGIIADNTAPVLESLELDKTEVTVGDSITITAKITDESALKGKPQIAFYSESDITETGAIHSAYLTSQGNDIYTGTITVTDNFVNGYYPAQWLSATDIYDNKKIYNLERTYPNLGFRVNGAQEDNTAPVLESLELDKTEVTVDDIITITAKITDESALKGKPQIAFYSESDITETGAIHSAYLTSQGNDIYTGTITVTDNFVNGYYPAQWLSVTDIYDNKKIYNLERTYPNLGFRVNGAQEDNTAPVLESLELDKTEVTVDDIITITAKITDESVLKGKPQIAFYSESDVTENGAIHSVYLTNQGNDIYAGTITVTDNFVNGYYPAQWLSVTDVYDNKKIYNLEKTYPNLGFRVLCDTHTWDKGVITRNATCTDNGEKIYTCTVCEATKKEDIKALGHKAVKDEAVVATCEKEGLTEGSHCSVCNKVLTEQKKVPATGHSWDTGKVTIAATYTKEGEKTYTCKNCGKTRTEKIDKLLFVSISVDEEGVLSGEKVGIIAEATGGTGRYTYKFIVCDDRGNWYKLRDYGIASAYIWRTGTAGKKTLYVDVKDGAGNVKRASLAYEVKSNEMYVSFKADPSGSTISGKEVKLNAQVTGGTGRYTYKFIVCDNRGNWYKLRDYGSASTYSWHTGAAGKKILYVDVKDGAGNVKRASLTYEVTDKNLTGVFTANPSGSAASGSNVQLSVKANGGSGKYTYKFLVCDAKGNWYRLRDFGSSSTYIWKTGAVGKKTLYVDIKDSEGTVKRLTMAYEVK